MKKYTFRSPDVKFRENDLTESKRNARAARSGGVSSSSGGVIPTTTAAPSYYLGQQVYSGSTGTTLSTGYIELTYAEYINIEFASEVVTSPLSNWLYISIPSSKSYIIYDSTEDITSEFTEEGTYDAGGITNTIVRKTNKILSSISYTYKLYIT